MTFLSGAFLAALPLVAVPVIIHLLNRRRRKVIRWGAMRFLAEAATRRRRMWRVNDLLLMLLRAAVVTAIILALAQPLVRSGLFAPTGARDVIVVLDTSMSTGRTTDSQTVFDREVERVADLVGRLGEGDMVRVLLASGSPVWLTPVPVAAGSEARGELLSRLRQIKPTLASADMLRAVQEAVQAEPATRGASRLITVVTDGQAYGWKAEAVEAWRRLAEARSKAESPTEVCVVNVGDRVPAGANLAVESLVASRSIAAPGQPLMLTATVRNRGTAPADGGLLAWSAGDSSLGVSSLKRLVPGESTTVSVEHHAGASGTSELQCRIEQRDVLDLDNTGRFVLQILDQVPILVVGAPAQSDRAACDTGYLLLALGYDREGQARSWKSTFRPVCIPAAELAKAQLGDYWCVILSGAGDVPADLRARLLSYVQRGGGLWIAAGDVIDQATFNRVYFDGEAALSPLALGEPVGQVADYEHGSIINPPATIHPATALLSDTKRLDLDRARVFRRYRFIRRPTDRDVSVLLTAGQGEPLVVEKQLGRGRVIVQGLPLGVRWSNLPACQAFVPLIHEWLWYLSESSAPRRNVASGEPLVVSVPASEQVMARVTGPTVQATPVVPRKSADRNEFIFERALVPGRYVMTLAAAGQPERTVPFDVRRDVEESDLTPLSAGQMEILATVGGMQFLADPLATQSTIGKEPVSSRPVWWWLLVGLLAVMAVELVLAWRLTTRRNAVAAGVTMTNDVHLAVHK
jgi:hypothetical protein